MAHLLTAADPGPGHVPGGLPGTGQAVPLAPDHVSVSKNSSCHVFLPPMNSASTNQFYLLDEELGELPNPGDWVKILPRTEAEFSN